MSNWYITASYAPQEARLVEAKGGFWRGFGASFLAGLSVIAPSLHGRANNRPTPPHDPPALTRPLEPPTKAPQKGPEGPQDAPKPLERLQGHPESNKGPEGIKGMPDLFVARVLFAETASASHQERYMVASVMKNRIGNKDFGDGSAPYSMRDVCESTNAFQAVGDSGNHLWSKKVSAFNDEEKAIWKDCLHLSTGNFTPVPNLVYYHDTSISRAPRNWSTYYHLSRPIVTDNFHFYKATRKR